MADCVVVWLSVCLVACSRVLVASQDRCPYLKLNEGDVCKQDNKGPWSCKPLNSCPKAVDQLSVGGITPEICGFKKTEVVVCCEPEVKIEKASQSDCKYLSLNEGAICNQEFKEPWFCKVLNDCPKVKEDLNNYGKEPDICGFNKTNVVVCCEPESKSKQKCREYAESVFIRLGDSLNGELTNYDTCNLETRRFQRDKRASGGTGVESKTREYPHMAVIGFGEASEIKWLCGGSLISDRFILTAAHCVHGPHWLGTKTWARLGDHNLQSEEDEEKSEAQPTTYEVIEYFVYDEFKELYHNIALMKLNTKVFFTEFIRPVCLLANPAPYEYAFATAWGKTRHGREDTLLTLNLSIVASTRCNDYFQARNSKLLRDGILEDQMICADNHVAGPDSCQGDSGGPLQVLLEDPYCMYSLVGVESFSSGCGNGNPFVFTRVSYYLPWIEGIVWP